MEGNFIDQVYINVRSGKGGAGSPHLHRAKFVEKGGPDGGDGGRGGHIYVRGSSNMSTLLHLRYSKHIFAQNGETGMKNRKHGKDGEDIVIDVPLGTVFTDADTGEYIFEVVSDQEKIILVKGGRGGWGNDHFKSPTNQTPRYFQPGEPAEERWASLELKLMADVGLVGMPNAGKSTLLSVVSAAKPKIADYAFTTLVPQLGMVKYHGVNSFVIADIPGIIEGASEGKGLGFRFLKHIQRNSVLLFMVSCTSENIVEEYELLLKETGNYNEELLDKPRVLAITKVDLCSEEDMEEIEKSLPKNVKCIFISSATQYNIDSLKDLLWKIVQDHKG